MLAGESTPGMVVGKIPSSTCVSFSEFGRPQVMLQVSRSANNFQSSLLTVLYKVIPVIMVPACPARLRSCVCPLIYLLYNTLLDNGPTLSANVQTAHVFKGNCK